MRQDGIIRICSGRGHIPESATTTSPIVITHWNHLPDTAVIAPSVDAFKIAIHKGWFNEPWKTQWDVIESMASHHH